MVVNVDGRTIAITATDHGQSIIDVHGKSVRVWKLVATCRDIELEWINTGLGDWLYDYWRAKYPNSTLKYHQA